MLTSACVAAVIPDWEAALANALRLLKPGEAMVPYARMESLGPACVVQSLMQTGPVLLRPP